MNISSGTLHLFDWKIFQLSLQPTFKYRSQIHRKKWVKNQRRNSDLESYWNRGLSQLRKDLDRTIAIGWRTLQRQHQKIVRMYKMLKNKVFIEFIHKCELNKNGLMSEEILMDQKGKILTQGETTVLLSARLVPFGATPIFFFGYLAVWVYNVRHKARLPKLKQES